MNRKKINVSNQELDRDIRNLYLDPDKDQYIPVVGDEYFYTIYGKERYEEMKARRAEEFKKEKERLGLF